MNPELREAIGEAVYSALDLDENERLGWNKTSERIREQCRKCGKKAIEEYKKWIDDNDTKIEE